MLVVADDSAVRSGGESLHPSPQVRRSAWTDLGGEWNLAPDDGDVGRAQRWWQSPPGGRRVLVPFPPESPASGIGDKTPHPVVWYWRYLGPGEASAAGLSPERSRLLLHFGAVDYHATVWLSGHRIGEHSGGHTPFTFDITDEFDPSDDNLLVVRVEDRMDDVSQPRGKQDWREQPHDIWYERTSGIWQPVWLEAVPRTHVTQLAWGNDPTCSEVRLELELDRPPLAPVEVRVELSADGRPLATVQTSFSTIDGTMVIPLRGARHRMQHEELLWSPENPRLIDATVTVSGDGPADSVHSYLGLRSVGTGRGHFLLNDRPYFVRAVLDQGYWPTSYLTAPEPDAYRAEVELIKSLGFNAVRIHQKLEDPRFLYWADRLGLLVWTEMPSAYEFSPKAIRRLTIEWMEAVARDRSHPSVVTWVPINESWGVEQLAAAPAQRELTRALASLTRALDPSRPVVSNDGWEHTGSDIVTIHDYTQSGDALRDRYASTESATRLLAGYGPAGRLVLLDGQSDTTAPLMVSEFGGIRFDRGDQAEAWGYATAEDVRQFEAALREVFGALQASDLLAGFCYTQLTDTRQEANGLTDQNRVPKLPVATIRHIVEGTGDKGVPQPHQLALEAQSEAQATNRLVPRSPLSPLDEDDTLELTRSLRRGATGLLAEVAQSIPDPPAADPSVGSGATTWRPIQPAGAN